MTVVGHCPRCGAPIYGEEKIEDFEAVDAEKRLGGEGPKVVYSCECRKIPDAPPPMFIPPAAAPAPFPKWVPHVVTSPNVNTPVPVDVSGTAAPALNPLPLPWCQS